MPVQPPSENIKQWWNDIEQNHSKFSCYAIILSLPSDTEIATYLNTFGEELNLISGENCLILALSQNKFRRYKTDKKFISLAINDQISNGHSLHIARILKIKFSEFPCLIIFNDIQSSEYALISLRGLTTENIAQKLKEVFSIIQESIARKEKPVKALNRQNRIENFRSNSKIIVGNLFNLGGKTLEKAMEIWIGTLIK